MTSAGTYKPLTNSDSNATSSHPLSATRKYMRHRCWFKVTHNNHFTCSFTGAISSDMTRTTHKAHPTPAFPVYCLDWADDETLILGGGGGASRSGISNMLVRNSPSCQQGAS